MKKSMDQVPFSQEVISLEGEDWCQGRGNLQGFRLFGVLDASFIWVRHPMERGCVTEKSLHDLFCLGNISGGMFLMKPCSLDDKARILNPLFDATSRSDEKADGLVCVFEGCGDAWVVGVFNVMGDYGYSPGSNVEDMALSHLKPHSENCLFSSRFDLGDCMEHLDMFDVLVETQKDAQRVYRKTLEWMSGLEQLPNPECWSIFSKKGVDMNATCGDFPENTALILSVERSDAASVHNLLQLGAYPEKANKKGETASQIAAAKGDAAVLAELENRMLQKHIPTPPSAGMKRL